MTNSITATDYLRRIGVEAAPPPTLRALTALQRAHLFHVPFENLSIGWGERIHLDEAWLLDKIVRRQRGGFCYELNGAFSWLLRTLGFRVERVEARVWNAAQAEFGPPFDHMALLVHLAGADAGDYLVDVGFGRAPRVPLRLDDSVQAGADGTFRVRAEHELHFLERQTAEDVWQPEHCFTRTPRRLEEYAAMCDYHQTSADSHFTRNRVCSLARPDGRISLTPHEFIVTQDDTRDVTSVADAATYNRLLLKHFGIRPPAE